jgi:hypothetical protein
MSGERKPRGQVHDLGYKRYQGRRRAQSSRYRVIGRKLVSIAWRGWWRMKLWVIGAALCTLVITILMYVSEGVSRFMRAGQKLPLSDALLPMSFQFFEISAFALSMTVLASAIAGDLRTGAFEFYFSRPLRARDYVYGKLFGALMLTGVVLFLGPVVLALVRIGLSEDVFGALHLLPRAALIGAVAAVVYAVMPVMFSAISSNRLHTVPAWGAFYFATAILIPVISESTGLLYLQALDIPRSLHTLAYAVFDVMPIFDEQRPPAWNAVLGLGGYLAVGVGVLYWRVSTTAGRGLGGGR